MTAAILISLWVLASPIRDTLLQPATVAALKEAVPRDRLASPVSVIPEEDLQRNGVYHPQGLSGIIPGLHIPEYGASLTSTIYLRGLGSRMENPVLGLYLDRPVVSVSADNTRYDPETAWNFEQGSRLRKGDLSAELSAYHIAVRNQQLTVFPPGMSTGRMMTNAGRSRSLGIETEARWTPGNFRALASWSWCDARFLRYGDGDADYAGKYIPYVPRHTLYASAGYGFRLGKSRLEADLAARGYGPVWWNEGNTLREPFRLLVSSRIALAYPRWEIYLRGENLTDASGRSFYFKSMGNEFFASIKPRILLTGISIKL